MAGVATNEPYQRVSQDNGVFDGALIGMAIGAGGAGAGVFGSRMSYNGIDKKVERERSNLEGQLENKQRKVDRAEKNYNNYADKAGPRFYEKKGYERGNQAEADIVGRGNRREQIVNQNRQGSLDSLGETTRASISQAAENAAHDLTKQRRGFGYSNPTVNPEDALTFSQVDDVRNASNEQRSSVNSHYDGEISQVRQNTMDNLSGNKDVKYRNTVDGRINGRIDKRHNKYMNAMNEAADVASRLGEVSQAGYADNLRSKHAYSKMGGWKNAAIIGASAVVSGGLGMAIDGLNG